jgi:hypothetical protein
MRVCNAIAAASSMHSIVHTFDSFGQLFEQDSFNEIGNYVGAAFALAGICIWSLRRRS